MNTKAIVTLAKYDTTVNYNVEELLTLFGASIERNNFNTFKEVMGERTKLIFEVSLDFPESIIDDEDIRVFC